MKAVTAIVFVLAALVASAYELVDLEWSMEGDTTRSSIVSSTVEAPAFDTFLKWTLISAVVDIDTARKFNFMFRID